eukprot:12521938-Heterocapsa_arctica.AAC.1
MLFGLNFIHRPAKSSKVIFSHGLVKVELTTGGSLQTCESKKMFFGLNFIHGPDHIGISAHHATMVERM